MDVLAGLDIGGTKCAASLGAMSGEDVTLLDKRRFPTPPTPTTVTNREVSIDRRTDARSSTLPIRGVGLRSVAEFHPGDVRGAGAAWASVGSG